MASTEPNKRNLEQQAEQIAEEVKNRTTNGNRETQSTTKPGGAERGGPDLDKAEEDLPPDMSAH